MQGKNSWCMCVCVCVWENISKLWIERDDPIDAKKLYRISYKRPTDLLFEQFKTMVIHFKTILQPKLVEKLKEMLKHISDKYCINVAKHSIIKNKVSTFETGNAVSNTPR